MGGGCTLAAIMSENNFLEKNYENLLNLYDFCKLV